MSARAYDRDLAWIHDVGFGDFARQAGPWLLMQLRSAGIAGGTVVDLGCGSGIWARQLRDAGYDVVGIDISPAMIDLAKRRVPAAQFRVGSYLAVRLPACVAVTSIGECFSYLFDGGGGGEQLTGLFERVFKRLAAGGLFVFDVATPARGHGPARHWREGPGWATLVEVEVDAKGMQLQRRITSFRKMARQYRRDHEVHRLQLFEPAEMARQLRNVGFRVRLVRGYGKLRFPKGLVGFVARKP